MDPIPSFHAVEWFTVPRGRIAMVDCDRERPRDDPGLAGTLVEIDGETFDCLGVDRRLPATPISKGERIALLVRAHQQV